MNCIFCNKKAALATNCLGYEGLKSYNCVSTNCSKNLKKTLRRRERFFVDEDKSYWTLSFFYKKEIWLLRSVKDDNQDDNRTYLYNKSDVNHGDEEYYKYQFEFDFFTELPNSPSEVEHIVTKLLTLNNFQ
jgi:hypothetical protein